MSLRFYANAPATALASSCSNSQLTVTVNSATGYPIQYPFTIIVDRGTGTEEAMSVTGAAGAVFTVTRAIDSTTAFAHSLGAVVEHGVTAQDVREPNAHINASTAVHGLAGAVVGTTDAQALTNKDLTAGTNTFPSSLATLAGAQALTNKTLGATNTINGFTASRFMEADGTGKIVSGTKVIPAGVVVGDTDAQTLTNKSLSASTTFVVDNTDATKKLKFTASGNTTAIVGTLATAFTTAKTVTLPDANDTLVGKATTDTLTNKTLSTGTLVGAATTDISAALTAFTPTWTGSTTNPTLGNGTLVGRYVQVGKMVYFRIYMLGGTTTTVGSGTYSFALPVAAHGTGEQSVSADFYDGAAHYSTVGLIPAGASAVSPFSSKGGTSGSVINVGSTSFSAGVAAIIVLTGTYEAA